MGASGSVGAGGLRRGPLDGNETTPEFHPIRRVTRHRVLLSSLYRVRSNSLGPGRRVCLSLVLLTLVVLLGTRTGLHSLPSLSHQLSPA